VIYFLIRKASRKNGALAIVSSQNAVPSSWVCDVHQMHSFGKQECLMSGLHLVAALFPESLQRLSAVKAPLPSEPSRRQLFPPARLSKV